MIDIEKIRKKRTVDELLEFGILNIDKPSGPTSFQVAEMVGKMVGARKFSHFGTLDPKVTGVLPIALNRACKLTGWFMKKNKTYVGIMHTHKDIEKKKLEQEMKKFVGKIKQLPPVKSRVRREERERQVFSWKILEKNGKNVLFETEVEAGTYIRKLIHDLGLKIGGAHMTELRRAKAGIFSEDDENFTNLYSLEKIKNNKEELKKIIIPAEVIGNILPVIQVKEKSVKRLLTGKPIFKEDMVKSGGGGEVVSVFSDDNFIGIYRKVDEKGIIYRAEFVRN